MPSMITGSPAVVPTVLAWDPGSVFAALPCRESSRELMSSVSRDVGGWPSLEGGRAERGATEVGVEIPEGGLERDVELGDRARLPFPLVSTICQLRRATEIGPE